MTLPNFNPVNPSTLAGSPFYLLSDVGGFNGVQGHSWKLRSVFVTPSKVHSFTGPKLSISSAVSSPALSGESHGREKEIPAPSDRAHPRRDLSIRTLLHHSHPRKAGVWTRTLSLSLWRSTHSTITDVRGVRPSFAFDSRTSTEETFSPFPSPEVGFQGRAEENGRQLEQNAGESAARNLEQATERRRQLFVREAAACPFSSPTQKCVAVTLTTLFAGFAMLGNLLVVCICISLVGFVLIEGAISLGKGYHHS